MLLRFIDGPGKRKVVIGLIMLILKYKASNPQKNMPPSSAKVNFSMHGIDYFRKGLIGDICLLFEGNVTLICYCQNQPLDQARFPELHQHH